VKSGASFTARPDLRDVGPTALLSLDCPLTTDMDGRALEEAFDPAIDIKRQGSSYRGADDSALEQASVYDVKEEAALRERLRALGYIE
jgi:hypothetical protein